MNEQSINLEPCSPQIDSGEPVYPNPSQQSVQINQNLLSPNPINRSHKSIASLKSQKKNSTSSFNTSIDTEEELQNSNEFEYNNPSLSDSQTNRQFHERLHMLSPNRFKKLKKKNRLTQIISGANYKSKSEHFQKLFKNLNPDEQLIIDYSCAFHRDILVHGRLYLSQNWLCFYANIFGWETLITIQWVDITAITKEKTAKVIPNAIQVLTDNEKLFFTTFVTRENAYTALFRIWQNALLGQPMQPEELKTLCKKYRQKKLPEAVDGEPVNDFLDETGDEVGEDDLTSTNDGSTEQLNKIGDGGERESVENSEPKSQPPPDPIFQPETSTVENENGDNLQERSSTNGEKLHTQDSVSRKLTSNFLNGSLGQEETKERIKNAFKNSIPNMTTRSFSKASDLFRKKKKSKARHHHHSVHLIVPDDEAGETTTDFEEGDSDVSIDNRLDEDVICPCHHTHTGTEYVNEEFDLDVDALYAHMFSQESDFMKRVFEERKHENWRYTALEKDEDGHENQILTYTLNLNYSIGPKTSETISKQKILKESVPGSFYIIITENKSIGVPYSDSFYASVRYCLTKASGNRSRLKVHGEIVYTKRVFGLVKNMISRNGDEAMKDYYVYLVDALRSESDSIPVQNNVIKRKQKKKSMKQLVKESNNKSIETNHRKKSHDTVKPVVSSPQLDTTRIQPVSTKALMTICIIVFLLLGMNIYLLKRLGALEGAVFVAKRGWLPKEMPSNKEEWKNLLEYQKNLHELELSKLKEVIGNTALLVRQVEESISSLYSELVKYDNSNHLSGNPIEEVESEKIEL